MCRSSSVRLGARSSDARDGVCGTEKIIKINPESMRCQRHFLSGENLVNFGRSSVLQNYLKERAPRTRRGYR